MGENIQEIGNALMKHNSFSFRILGLQMVKKNNTIKGKQQDKQYHDKLYKLFLKSIDKETAKKLTKIDLELSKLVSEFENKTGWTMTNLGVYLDNNFARELEKRDDSNVFKIPRDHQIGFYLPPLTESSTYIEKRMRVGEEQFLMQHQEELCIIHELMAEKENIMSGDYNILNENIDYSLVNMITEYLGYPRKKDNINLLKLTKGLL